MKDLKFANERLGFNDADWKEGDSQRGMCASSAGTFVLDQIFPDDVKIGKGYHPLQSLSSQSAERITSPESSDAYL